ncbi:MAG: response regulator transcription factor [Blastocatellia bacterium]
MARVLVVEDEPSVAIALRDSLESDDHQVTLAGDGSEGFRLASRTGEDAPDLILLDLMLPKMSGLEICQRLRAVGIETPMIMLTARGAASDAAFGLKLGADDYIPKPFDVGELLARVAAVLRRSKPRQPEAHEAIRIGNVELDLRRLHATKNGVSLDLQPTRILKSCNSSSRTPMRYSHARTTVASHLGNRNRVRAAGLPRPSRFSG